MKVGERQRERERERERDKRRHEVRWQKVPTRAYNRLLQKEPNLLHKSTDKQKELTWSIPSLLDNQGSCYRLDGPGIESRWGRDFPRPSRPALDPTQPPLQLVSGLFPWDKAAGAWRWRPLPYNDEVKNYIGWTLPLPLPGPDSKGRLSTRVQLLMLSQLPMLSQALSSAVARILTP
jgi:hypothetical protein